MKKISNNYRFFCILIISILLSTGIFIGCGGGSGTGNMDHLSIATPVSDPTKNIATEPAQEILSTVTEISTNSSTVSSSTGGEIKHDNVTLQVPPEALSSNEEIKLSTVSITDKTGRLYGSNENNHGPIYKISSGNPKKGIVLNKPVEMQIQVDPSYKDPGLAIWTGENWIALDKEYIVYDNTAQTITIQLTNIPRDNNEFILNGDLLESTIVVTSYPNANFYPGDSNYELVYNYPSKYESNHFTIHYTTNVTADYIQELAQSFEACYNLYKNQIGYNTPISFSFTADNGNTYQGNDRRMIYIKYPGAPNETTGGWANYQGIIALPVVSATISKSIAYHELFHFVQYNYGSTPSWFKENTADLLGFYAYNHINTTTSPKKYDCSYEQAAGYGHWDGANSFRYSLDKYESGSFWQYYNWITWAYSEHYYDATGIKNILTNFSNSSNAELQDLDSAYIATTGKSLKEVYFNAFEDFYIYGQVYNKVYFNKLSDRDYNEPLCAPNSGYSSHYNYEAFNSGNNPYYNGSSVSVEHLSGECYNFKASGQAGSLSLTISSPDPNNLKIKVFSFKNNNNVYEFVNTQEFPNQNLSNKLIPYSDGVTDITVLLENSSLTADNNLTLKACGSASSPGVEINIESLIPEDTNSIRLNVTRVSNGSAVKTLSITKPSGSNTWTDSISDLPKGEKLKFEFSALDSSNNLLAHREEYRIIPSNGILTINPVLGITIKPDGTFYPSSLNALPKDIVVFGNTSSDTTSTISFNLTDYPITLGPIAQFNPNANPYEGCQTLLSYNFPRRIVLGDSPDGTHNIQVTNTVKDLSGNTVNTTYMTFVIQKGNSTLIVTKGEGK